MFFLCLLALFLFLLLIFLLVFFFGERGGCVFWVGLGFFLFFLGVLKGFEMFKRCFKIVLRCFVFFSRY